MGSMMADVSGTPGAPSPARPSAELRREPTAQSITRPLPKTRVLVVDNERMIRVVLTENLKDAGFECLNCSSGSEALEMLARGSFDVVVADLRMPGMDGLQLLEQVRRKHSQIAFLMATGVDNVRMSVQAMKQGAADYIVKPFQFDAVIMSVERALEKKRLELEVEKYRQHLEEMVEERTQQLQSALRRVELTYDETLQSLGWALDLRDTETAGHSRRVSHYALEIANAMGCSSDEKKQIARGAYLHDIGKLGVPDAILLKKGKLTDEERPVMQTHAQIGYDMVSRIAFLAPAAQIVLTHHERYDGLGYPLGLQGEAIPFGSRIFAVADTLDAITSDRPYRRASAFSVAKSEIQRESERQFDPAVTRAFLSLPEELWGNIRQAGGVLDRTGSDRVVV